MYMSYLLTYVQDVFYLLTRLLTVVVQMTLIYIGRFLTEHKVQT